jgi:hypothetical protein
METRTSKHATMRQHLSVSVDASLDEKYEGKILFPEKVARAKASL